MGTMASQITSLTIVYWTVYSDADQRKHQSSASLAFVRGIHRGPVSSPHKWPVTLKMFPFDDVIMLSPFLHRWHMIWVKTQPTAPLYTMRYKSYTVVTSATSPAALEVRSYFVKDKFIPHPFFLRWIITLQDIQCIPFFHDRTLSNCKWFIFLIWYW